MAVRDTTPARWSSPSASPSTGGVHLEEDPEAVDLEVVHPGEPVEPGQRPHRLGGHRGAGQVPQLGQRPGLDPAPGPDDAHPVAQPLDLGEDVAGEQHRAPAVAEVVDALLEDRLHQRVEAARGLVEDQQLDVAGQGGDQRDLLPVALGVGAPLLGGVELEALEQLGAATFVEAAAQPAEQVDRPRRPVRDGHRLTSPGHVGQPAVQRRRRAPRVAAEQPDLSAVLAQHARAAPGWSWTCPSRWVRGSRGSRPARRQVEAVEGADVPERLDQAGDLDGIRHEPRG